MNEINNLLKDAHKEVRNQKVIGFISKYKFLLLALVLVITIVGSAMLIYKSHVNKIANNNSLMFSEVQEQLTAGNEDAAIKLLNELAASGTNGYKLVATFQKISLALHDKKYNDAILQLKHINQLNVPTYYKELANFLVFSIRLDNDKDNTKLLADLKANLSPSNSFYYSTLELYDVALTENKNYEDALTVANQIINADAAPVGIKERTKSLKSVILAYVK